MNKDDNAQATGTDDAEFAKVLEGINGGGSSPSLPAPASGGLQFEETPAPSSSSNNVSGEPSAETAVENSTESHDDSAFGSSIPSVEVVADEPVYQAATPASPAPVIDNDELSSIKKHALEELRPLVDKLDLPADEKFDTLLLIIRSTDDQALVNSAYETAKLIEDETKRAQALLDVIKEIDYFANQSK